MVRMEYLFDPFCYPCNGDQHYAEWTLEENKMFEKTLAFHPMNSMDLFQKIAMRVPGKTIGQITQHLQSLVEDVKFIEAYAGPITIYGSTTYKHLEINHRRKHDFVFKNQKNTVNRHRIQKNKGTRWTKEEHEKFIVGLSKYGKGDWRSISRNIVQTKTPTQVASHAQKYFIRLAKLSSTLPISNSLTHYFPTTYSRP